MCSLYFLLVSFQIFSDLKRRTFTAFTIFCLQNWLAHGENPERFPAPWLNRLPGVQPAPRPLVRHRLPLTLRGKDHPARWPLFLAFCQSCGSGSSISSESGSSPDLGFWWPKTEEKVQQNFFIYIFLIKHCSLLMSKLQDKPSTLHARCELPPMKESADLTQGAL